MIKQFHSNTYDDTHTHDILLQGPFFLFKICQHVASSSRFIFLDPSAGCQFHGAHGAWPKKISMWPKNPLGPKLIKFPTQTACLITSWKPKKDPAVPTNGSDFLLAGTKGHQKMSRNKLIWMNGSRGPWNFAFHMIIGVTLQVLMSDGTEERICMGNNVGCTVIHPNHPSNIYPPVVSRPLLNWNKTLAWIGDKEATTYTKHIINYLAYISHISEPREASSVHGFMCICHHPEKTLVMWPFLSPNELVRKLTLLILGYSLWVSLVILRTSI